MNLTERAYNYAVGKKAVSQQVIEAWKAGWESGQNDIKNKSILDLLKIIRNRFRSKEQIEQELGMSGVWRGLNAEEILEASQFEIFNNLVKEYE